MRSCDSSGNMRRKNGSLPNGLTWRRCAACTLTTEGVTRWSIGASDGIGWPSTAAGSAATAGAGRALAAAGSVADAGACSASRMAGAANPPNAAAAGRAGRGGAGRVGGGGAAEGGGGEAADGGGGGEDAQGGGWTHGRWGVRGRVGHGRGLRYVGAGQRTGKGRSGPRSAAPQCSTTAGAKCRPGGPRPPEQ